jgi:hypothetical protein
VIIALPVIGLRSASFGAGTTGGAATPGAAGAVEVGGDGRASEAGVGHCVAEGPGPPTLNLPPNSNLRKIGSHKIAARCSCRDHTEEG